MSTPNPYQPPPAMPPGQPPYFGGQYPLPAPGPWFHTPVPARTTNAAAIASLVLGILWVFWLGSIAAVLLGFLAKKQIRERGEDGAGLATAGMVLGWIGVGTLVAYFLAVAVAAGLAAGGTY